MIIYEFDQHVAGVINSFTERYDAGDHFDLYGYTKYRVSLRKDLRELPPILTGEDLLQSESVDCLAYAYKIPSSIDDRPNSLYYCFRVFYDEELFILIDSTIARLFRTFYNKLDIQKWPSQFSTLSETHPIETVRKNNERIENGLNKHLANLELKAVNVEQKRIDFSMKIDLDFGLLKVGDPIG